MNRPEPVALVLAAPDKGVLPMATSSNTTSDHAEYLAATLADYVHNQYPLEFLTGVENPAGHPDRNHIARLADALSAFGHEVAASKLRPMLK